MRGSRLVTTERVVCIAAPDTGDVVDAVADCVTSHGLRFMSHEVGTPIEDERLSGGDVLGVAVGGDGTFLSAAEVFEPYEIPFVSVDSGTLGFLTRTPPDAIEATFGEILEGRATVTEYQQVRVTGPDIDEIGVNEVQFDAFEPVTETETALGDPDTVQQCTLDIFVDGEYVGTYEGGGLLVNTPTGSTAMALSADGPIHLPADNETLQLTPLHTANTGVRPMVVEASAEITVVPSTKIRVSVDGVRPEFVAKAGTTFQVTGAQTPLYVVDTTHSTTILDTLREKLGWNSQREPTQVARQETEQGPTNLYTTAADIAREAAYAAGRPVRQMYERIEGSNSGVVSDDLVGAAISGSEQIITTILQTEFPNHSIISEGWTVNDGSDTYTWVIDPLDGIGNFTHGNPSFTVAVSLLAENTPVVGVVYSPVTEELFHAVSGRGAYRNETPIETTAKQRLDESMLLSGYDPTGAFLKCFYRKVRGVRRLGSASLHLCYVAAGSADAHWEFDTYPWDVAAGLCILREAGGIATHADGSAYELTSGETNARESLLASNGPLHDTLLDAFPEDGFS
jgi:myo-inositol-1(or 4)-monophosphatase